MSSGTAPNRLPILLAMLFFGIVITVIFARCSGPTIRTGPAAEAPSVATPEIAARPSDADSTEATIKTLTAKFGDLTQLQLDQVKRDAKLEALEKQLAAANESSDLTAMRQELAMLQQQNQALTDRLMQVETRAASPAEAVGSDFGIEAGAVPGNLSSGIPDATQAATQGASTPEARNTIPAYVWVRPLDQPAAQLDANGVPMTPIAPTATTLATGEISVAQIEGTESVPNTFIADPQTANGQATLGQTAAITPRFTLPVNSTLLDNTAMTAFIGRIPVNGTVSDGYRFKILASSEGLATNGFHLPPDIKSMVFSGTAVGDWNLSCVRGQIDSATFTYEDGTIQTYGGEVATNTGNSEQNVQRRVLGFISDQNGVPCISGKRVTNAPKVLGALFTASAFEAAARGYAEAQTSSVVTATGGVVRTVNDAAKFGAFTGLAGGATDAKEWLTSRLGQIFDAVFVPGGAKVAIHIESQINLDHNANARRLSYDVSDTSNQAID